MFSRESMYCKKTKGKVIPVLIPTRGLSSKVEFQNKHSDKPFSCLIVSAVKFLLDQASLCALCAALALGRSGAKRG